MVMRMMMMMMTTVALQVKLTLMVMVIGMALMSMAVLDMLTLRWVSAYDHQPNNHHDCDEEPCYG